MSAVIALIPILFSFAIMGITAIGWIKYRQWRAKHQGLRFPITEPLLRPAGHSLSEKITDTSADLFGALISGSFGSSMIIGLHAIQTAYFHQPESLFRYLVSGAGIAFLFFTSIKTFLKTAAKLRDLRMGWVGELATAEALSDLQGLGYRVFHDIPADGFNVDHIAVGPQGVFAVETKTRIKRAVPKGPDHRVVFNGKVLTFPSFETDEPLTQAKRQAKWVSEWLSKATGESLRAIPAVSLPGWFVDRTGVGEVLVFTPKAAVYSLTKSGYQTPLTPARVKQIAFQIEQKCRTIDYRKRLI